MNLQTARLTIRNLSIGDLESFYDYRSNPEVVRFQSFDVITRDGALAFIKEYADGVLTDGHWTQFGIELRESGNLIGDCAVKIFDGWRQAEIGITMSHRHQRKGYAKEVMTGLLSFLFDNKKLHRVVETVDAKNTASIRLLQNTGFRCEGHFIENIFFKGEWGSEFQYAMLASDWDALRS